MSLVDYERIIRSLKRISPSDKTCMDEFGYTLPTIYNMREQYVSWSKNKHFHREEKGVYGDVANGYFNDSGNFVPYTMPAIIYSNGDKEWYKNGICHRDDLDKNGRVLPAVICHDGSQYWYKNGIICRDDLDEKGRVLPARIFSNGDKHWFKNGYLHRDDLDENGRVLPAICNSDGSQSWHKNGLLHRDDRDENGKVLPAIIYSEGDHAWYNNGNFTNVRI